MCSRARAPGSGCVPANCRCSTRRRAARCARRCTTVARVAELIMDGVTKRFGATVAVADLTLTAGDGEFLVLLGPTGAGKTTTLRVVAGLERADGGRVLLGGRDVTREPPAARHTP